MLGVPFIFNIFFGHYPHDRPRKKPLLLLGIYLRAVSYLGMAVFTFLFADTVATLVLLSLFGWVFLFAFSGGFAGVSYADIIGSLVPKGKRSRLYAAKQFAGGVAMLLGGLVVTRVLTLESLGYPANYGLILGIGFVGLLVASGAFWFIREPAAERRPEGAGSFRRSLATVPSIIRDDRTFLLDLAPEDRRTVYVGINGTLNFTKVLLPVLGGALMDLLGFRVTFGIVVIAMLAGVGLLRDVDDGPAVPAAG